VKLEALVGHRVVTFHDQLGVADGLLAGVAFKPSVKIDRGGYDGGLGDHKRNEPRTGAVEAYRISLFLESDLVAKQ
jgi:hypothetical protein